MSNSTASLRRKIGGAGDLQSVVRTMKALAASNIGQYEQSVRSLADYFSSVEAGLGVCFRKFGPTEKRTESKRRGSSLEISAVVFGSDQGLVGGFDDEIADYAIKTLAGIPGTQRVWAVGERVYAHLEDAGLPLSGLFAVPNSVRSITPLIAQILVESESQLTSSAISVPGHEDDTELHLFYNRPTSGAVYEPVHQRLLPLDLSWQLELAGRPWPTKILPEVMGNSVETLRSLISEYLFVAIFRACAESLASENASRLAAMQRADKNIDELLVELSGTFYRLRQSDIDEELFDVISGFETLGRSKSRQKVAR
ncbi:MAG: F0F1 ATP synthase subunit gamma [Desulfuromonadaceae bacterium]|nr:F0F1 ATP synthase subunit gamma [Desulfuromonadaceae bacterium]MDD2848300.1 F0F1 ATP synthase subunit gamma [Desulfuromonadaceae bacterium]